MKKEPVNVGFSPSNCSPYICLHPPADKQQVCLWGRWGQMGCRTLSLHSHHAQQPGNCHVLSKTALLPTRGRQGLHVTADKEWRGPSPGAEETVPGCLYRVRLSRKVN